MTTLTKAEVLKEIRKAARDLGMTFKVDDSILLNGNTAYKLVERRTGRLIAKNFTLNTAYGDSLNGTFARLAFEHKTIPID